MARVEITVPRSLGPGPSAPTVVRLEASTVAQALRELERGRPELRGSVLAADGAVRRSVAVYLAGTDVRELDAGTGTILHDGDAIEVIPALGGG